MIRNPKNIKKEQHYLKDEKKQHVQVQVAPQAIDPHANQDDDETTNPPPHQPVSLKSYFKPNPTDDDRGKEIATLVSKTFQLPEGDFNPNKLFLVCTRDIFFKIYDSVPVVADNTPSTASRKYRRDIFYDRRIVSDWLKKQLADFKPTVIPITKGFYVVSLEIKTAQLPLNEVLPWEYPTGSGYFLNGKVLWWPLSGNSLPYWKMVPSNFDTKFEEKLLFGMANAELLPYSEMRLLGSRLVCTIGLLLFYYKPDKSRYDYMVVSKRGFNPEHELSGYVSLSMDKDWAATAIREAREETLNTIEETALYKTGNLAGRLKKLQDLMYANLNDADWPELATERDFVSMTRTGGEYSKAYHIDNCYHVCFSICMDREDALEFSKKVDKNIGPFKAKSENIHGFAWFPHTNYPFEQFYTTTTKYRKTP